MALGPLGLKLEDLFYITYGELLELIEAYNYKVYLNRQENVLSAMYISSCFGGKIDDITDLTGIWVEGEILNRDEYNKYIINKIRKNKRVKLSNE